MHDPRNLALAILAIAVLAAVASRYERADRPPGVFWGIWRHAGRAVSGRNLIWLGFSVFATVVLIATGWERWLQDVFQRGDLVSRELLWALLRGGTYWTPALALVVLAVGRIRKQPRVWLAGAAAMQAVLVAFVITHVLKCVTGRLGPLHPARPDRAPFPMTESTTDFAFDFWNRAVGDGRFFWPSGHTMSSMVLVTALWACFPERRWIAWVGYPLVAIMGLGMIDGDFHWTSDVVAGLCLGLAAGTTVGRGMRAEWDRRNDARPRT